ncbi:MAG: rod-binding protein [Planctomycetota bacterium]|jgi:Rod binding domain-containing protein|nr:rod-binding protein [Planctomycetota bacterium]
MNIMDIYSGGLNPVSLTSISRQNDQEDKEEALRLGQKVANTGAAAKTDPERLRGVAEDFVSVFMNQVMKSMRATVQENPAVHGDNGEKFFTDMLDSQYAGKLAGGSGYGLTDLVYQALLAKTRVKPDATGAGEEVEAVEVAPAAESGEL